MMKTFVISDLVGNFAENKDDARDLRVNNLKPLVDKGEKICLDFKGVDSSTQSFIHALISEFFQENGEDSLGVFEFKNCNKAVQTLITTVINYSLE
ncbi:MAG: STAS-like domain-containing protein [Bacteroidia bacterium]|nr:STAS-like domain-containing protein [Bacteroidia bacterium]